MTTRSDRRTVLALGAAALAAPMLGLRSAAAAVPDGAALRPMAENLREPWSLAFLPDGSFLVTERDGRLSHWAADGGRRLASVEGVPRVVTGGQAGLFDVMVPRDFADSRQVYLAWTAAIGRGSGTALGVGRLSADGGRLEGFRTIFAMHAPGRGGRHFGGRIVELPDGTLALTTGDRGEDALAQDLSRHEGKVLRLARDGSVPADNPFVGQAGARPEIWSYGHRNPQGMVLDAQGGLWTSAHGARGGDEINRIRPGANYGWPVITYGRSYSGLPIGIGTEAPGMEQPLHYWDPSIAPSGHAIHSGRMFPEFAGRHLIGSLKFDYVAVMDPSTPGKGGWAETRIETRETGRVRDVREGPDGAIWVLSVKSGAAFRIAKGAA
jgi:aldose sugar dehydrogenase